MDIAPDASLLARTTPRRLLTALQAMRGHAVIMLPAVGDEMAVRVMDAAERQLRQRAVATDGYDSAALDRAVRDVRRAARRWLRDEALRDDAAWTAPDPRRERVEEYGRVLERMPDGLFLDEREGRMNVGDRRMLAEAIVHEVPMLATGSTMARRGIGHLNAWLEREGFAPRTRIHDADFAVERALAHDGIDHGVGCLRAVLGAVMPARIADLERGRLEESLGPFLETLRRGGMRRTAVAAAKHCARLDSEMLLRELRAALGDRPPRSGGPTRRRGDAGGAKTAGRKW